MKVGRQDFWMGVELELLELADGAGEIRGMDSELDLLMCADCVVNLGLTLRWLDIESRWCLGSGTA